MFSEFIFIEINYKITATEGLFLWKIAWIRWVNVKSTVLVLY